MAQGIHLLKLSEDQIQTSVVNWARWVLPPSWRVFAIPNGGLRNKITAARMKRTGVMPGVFDICIIGPAPRCYWIEMKIPGGKLSGCQQDFRDFLVGAGWSWGVAYTLADVQSLFLLWQIPTKIAK